MTAAEIFPGVGYLVCLGIPLEMWYDPHEGIDVRRASTVHRRGHDGPNLLLWISSDVLQ